MQHSSSPPPPPPQSTQMKDAKSQSTQNMKDPGFEQSQPPEKSNRASSEEGSADALAEPFPGFQHEEVLAKPYDDELRRDIEFQERMSQMILDVILNLHAWSTSRPEYESANAGDTLLDETQSVLTTEREQGMSLFSFEQNRLQLLEFVNRIKSALATLTGLVL